MEVASVEEASVEGSSVVGASVEGASEEEVSTEGASVVSVIYEIMNIHYHYITFDVMPRRTLVFVYFGYLGQFASKSPIKERHVFELRCKSCHFQSNRRYHYYY